MKTKPSIWLLEPAQYRMRIELCFTDTAGRRLGSKVWDCQWSRLSPPQILLVQADVQSVERAPEVKETGRNAYLITTAVSGLRGELITTTFCGFQPETARRQMAAHPVTLGLVADASGVHFSFHVGQPGGRVHAD